MPFIAPTVDDIVRAGADLGLELSVAEAKAYLGCMARLVNAYETVDSLADECPEAPARHASVRWPEAGENSHNAWHVHTAIKGASAGILAGKRAVLKDNICLSGVPMMNGSKLYEGFVPGLDATVVSRLLEAGAEIIGKATCESFCYSGGSHTSESGPVCNPWSPSRSAGGSSSGCTVLLSTGEADMALGCDQAGSIRIPAAFCGVYGLKPSYGLVPYSGIMASEVTVDHVGPMSRTVADNALLLEAIAGPDGLDPRQQGCQPQAYTEALDQSIEGMRIGILREGFGTANAEPEVDRAVRQALTSFELLGASLSETTIPMHRISGAIRAPIAVEGGLHTILRGNGFPPHGKDLYILDLMAANAAWRGRASELPEPLKYIALFGQHVSNQHGASYYGKAQNIVRRLTAAYDAAFADFDLLVMPTVPMRATPLPSADAPAVEVIQRAHEMMANTAAFTVTGHPALSMPCALSEGLPVGMMLVSRRFDECAIYRAAHAFEGAVEWQTIN